MPDHCEHCGSPRDLNNQRPWRCRRCGALVPWTAEPAPGEPIRFGPYTLVRRIAAGGMGVVYEARRGTVQGFEKPFALKRLLPALSFDQDFVTMLVDEAKICSQLEHPNIVQVFELDAVEGEYYIAMEYVPGGTMAMMLRFCAATRRLLPVPVVAYLISEALKGLAYAHDGRRGEAFVHRDVSPQNIMLGRDGRVKLTDFGIAKAIASSTVSRIGTVKGKLAYMAPELLTGGRSTPRVDVFAMGVLMHESFAAKRLFRADTEAALISAVLRNKIPPLSTYRNDVPRSVERVIRSALTREPDLRYPDAAALRKEFVDALPPGLLEAGAQQTEKWIREYYGYVGLPGETLEFRVDAPVALRNQPPGEPGPFLPQPSDSFPTALGQDKPPPKRWFIGVVIAAVLAVLAGATAAAVYGLRTPPGTADAAVVAVLAGSDAAAVPAARDASVVSTLDGASVDKKRKKIRRKLTRRDIVRTFGRQTAALNRCAAQHRAVLPKGGVKLALVIKPEGKVSNAVLAPESLRGSGLDRCLAKVVRKMRFPRQSGPETKVTVPLEFQIK